MRHFVWSTLVLCLTVGVSAGAEMSPNFELELSLASKHEFVSGIIILESPIDVRSLDFALHARQAKRSERYAAVYDALRRNARETQPKFIAELEAAKASGLINGYTAYWIENLFVVSATPAFFNSLKNRGDIKYLSENFQAALIEPVRSGNPTVAEADETRRPRRPLDTETTTPGQDAIGATRVNRELGITGAGVLVANLDTGVDGNHPALASRWRGVYAPASEAWLDVIGSNPSFPEDQNSHGTHVMGTICGREITAGGDTITVGSAPDAEWIACNAIDQGVGQGFNNDVIAAYQWFANPDGDSTTLDDVPAVVQNSWGVNQNFPGYSTCFDFWNTAIANLEALGCVVTFSAGNEGPSASSMRSPAIHSLSEVQMFSVGAVEVLDGDQPPYAIASFSSRGPSPCAGTHIKPEVVAPGVSVNSSVPGGGYNDGFSGTSMAGPHVAGIVALMRQACPDCDPITIKEALLNTAIDNGYPPNGNDNTHGYGFIDGYEAVLSVFNMGVIQGVVTTSGQALEGVDVAVVGQNRHDLTDATGAYSLGLSAGTYSLAYSKFGFGIETVTDVAILEEDTIVVNVELDSLPRAVVSGYVFDSANHPLAGALVRALDVPVTPVNTDEQGFYALTLPVGLSYNLRAFADVGAAHTSFQLTGDTTIHFYMPRPLFCYDFESGEQGWTVGAAGDNATNGVWHVLDPELTQNLDSIVCQPDTDHTVTGVNCFVTNGMAGGAVGANDVDGGRTTLLSPIWNLSGESSAMLELHTWFTNDNGNNPGQDDFDVDVSSDGGATWISLLSERRDWEEWRRSNFILEDYIALTNQVRVRIIARDDPPGSLVEALVDDVCILASGIQPPEQLTVLVESNGLRLSWLPVPGAGSYTVWRSAHFPPLPASSIILGTVTDSTYLDLTALDTLGFYFVTANR